MFPILINAFTLSGTFYLFSTVAMLAVMFGLFILPETKGKTLSDINRMFYTRPIINCDVCRMNRTEKDTKYSACLQDLTNEEENIIKKKLSIHDAENSFQESMHTDEEKNILKKSPASEDEKR